MGLLGEPGQGPQVRGRLGPNLRRRLIVTPNAPESEAAVVAASCGSPDVALHPSAIAHACGIDFGPSEVAEVFKTHTLHRRFETGRPFCRQRFIRSWLSSTADEDFAGQRLHAWRLHDRDRDSMAENLKRVAWNSEQDVARPADRPLTATGAVVALRGNLAIEGAIELQLSDAERKKRRAAWRPHGSAFWSGYLLKYAQRTGSARHGAVTPPGGAAEKACHADI